MDKVNLKKHIMALCEIKGIQVSGAEMRSYNTEQLKTVYKIIKSSSTICNKNNSFYKISKTEYN